MHKWVFSLNIVIFIILTASLVYFLSQKQDFLNTVPVQKTQEDEKPPASSKINENTTPTPQVLTKKDTEAAIAKYTNTTDRKFFEPFMEKTVSVILYATDCCQPMSAKDAIGQIDYINKGMPFTFDQKNTTIAELKANNPEFANTFIGISQTGEQAIIYSIAQGTNLIESVQMSVSWKLFEK